ncbi:hypothetical protein ACGFIF_13105 [Kribbella sp. NPDC049174]|uniref:hypothetical protein n=1 Tax=Kribbella sp. NPDC049174 TaxID=3364112 RepID=UPI00371C4EB7
MNVPGKRLILGAAVAVAALGVGGVAYAASDDPAPQQGYVTIEDGATTPSPGTGSENGPQGNGTEGQAPGSGSAGRNGADCPEKNGQGQGEAQPSQPETQPSQPSQPEQTQPDAAENA